MSRGVWRVALTVAGVDPIGGAGATQDVKTFAALGVHGASAITCVTFQDTRRVYGYRCLDAGDVARQIAAVWGDSGFDAAKTGMLGTAQIVEAVAGTLGNLGVPLVVDPVYRAGSGDSLGEAEALDALRRSLLPRATVATPNAYEASELSGIKVRDLDSAIEAAKAIHREFGVAVVVKGGHVEEVYAIDVVYDGSTVHTLEAPRVPGEFHGAGCVFSAALTAELAKRKPLLEAVRTAKLFTYAALSYAAAVGRGRRPVNAVAQLELDAEKWRAYEAVAQALRVLESRGEVLGEAVPEVQSQLVYAVDPRYARSPGDVVAVSGRIVRRGGRAVPAGPPEFGASSHLARKVLAAMERDPATRSAYVIRFDEAYVDAARRLGLAVAVVDRRAEPLSAKLVEGGSMRWVVEEAVRQVGRVPDVIADLGDWGKEPLITVFGRTPLEALDRAYRIVLGSRGRGQANRDTPP